MSMPRPSLRFRRISPGDDAQNHQDELRDRQRSQARYRDRKAPSGLQVVEIRTVAACTAAAAMNPKARRCPDAAMTIPTVTSATQRYAGADGVP
jgi:hypothetical protein